MRARSMSRVRERKATPAKRFAATLLNILSTLLLVAAVCFTVAVVAITLTSKDGTASIAGWKPYVVLSDSMQKDFQVGDVVVTRAVDPADIRPGDIIAFSSIDPDANGQVFTHKVREATTYQGEPAFVTYGTTTGDNDAYPALASHVQGRFVFSVPKAGYVFDFFKSPMGYVVLVLIPFSILIGLQVAHIVRMVRDMQGADAADAASELAERERALVAERSRADAMQAELTRLRASAAQSAPHGAARHDSALHGSVQPEGNRARESSAASKQGGGRHFK